MLETLAHELTNEVNLVVNCPDLELERSVSLKRPASCSPSCSSTFSSTPNSDDEEECRDGGKTKKLAELPPAQKKEVVLLDVAEMSPREGLEHALTNVIASQDGLDEKEPFYLVDLGHVYEQHLQWLRLLPRVEPFYAIKCNSDVMILKLLAALGLSFDCASQAEFDTILGLGVEASKIIFAHPCKSASHLQAAMAKGVTLMTFDNEYELDKIHRLAPHARLVIRIRTDDSKSSCQLGLKFGASLSVVPALLRKAKGLGLNVEGVSFHVGSGCEDPSSFYNAIATARKVFEEGAAAGFSFTLLDIGGGFPPSPSSFTKVAVAVNRALNTFFPRDSKIRVIAEPGRYYVTSAASFCVNVIGKELREDDISAHEVAHSYVVNDGVFGAFNCVFYDHYNPVVPNILRAASLACPSDMKTFGCVPTKERDALMVASVTRYELLGPTGHSEDVIVREGLIEELDVGDWLYYENMGAYTMSSSSSFSSFKPLVKYCFSCPGDGSVTLGFEDIYEAPLFQTFKF